MNGLDVDAFVSSQRAKLIQEKSRLERNPRKVKGILPSDSLSLENTNKMRRERQVEYQEFLRHKHSSTRSVAEIRKDLAHEREKELNHKEAKSDQRKDPEYNDYSSFKDKKRVEEQYQGQVHDDQSQRSSNRRKQWNDYDDDDSKVRFEDVDHSERRQNRSTWDEEERELMQWTRNQAHSSASHIPWRNHRRSQTPPSFDPQHASGVDSKTSIRSISAPSVASAGIASLGRREEDVQTKRRRQMRYAEELRTQIEEKQGSKEQPNRMFLHKRRSKHVKDRENGESFAPLHQHNGSRDEDSKKSYVTSQRRHNSHFTDVENRAPCKHYGSEDEDDPDGQPRRHTMNGPRKERYYDHDSSTRIPPPPPPRFHEYGPPPHGWRYYPPPPPHSVGYESDPYSSYYPHYQEPRYPHSYNMPPPSHGSHPFHEPHPPQKPHWDEREGVQSKHPRILVSREEERRYKRIESSPPPKRHSNMEPEMSPFHSSEERKASKTDKSAYRAELKKQIEEKKAKERKKKMTEEEYSKQNEVEIYDPFGKGGCGAPVRDQFGNLVADLKQMRKINENRLSNTSPKLRSSGENQTDTTDLSPRTILTYDKIDDENVKRASLDNYRDFLRQQVKEKEEMKRKEKERQKIEEQKELDQLEKDRKRLQEQYQQELERQKMKEEAARKKNEAIKREAELKRQMAIMKQEEEARKEEAERRALALKRLSENMSGYHAEKRSDSPPVPALRHKMKQFSNPPPSKNPDTSGQSIYRSSSPPVPALRNKPPPKIQVQDVVNQAATKDNSEPVEQQKLVVNLPVRSSPESEQTKLLNQLGAMRLLLQAELAKQHQESHAGHSDIFEKAKQQKPKIAAPKVAKTNTAGAVGESNELNPNHDNFVSTSPSSELQQRALFRHNQNQLKKAHHNHDHIESVQIPVNSRHPFCSDNETDLRLESDRPAQKPLDQLKMWEEHPQNTNVHLYRLESNDNNIAARNEERARRLDAILQAGSRPLQRTLGNEEGSFNFHHGTREHSTRQSERSLECDTQHLPVD